MDVPRLEVGCGGWGDDDGARVKPDAPMRVGRTPAAKHARRARQWVAGQEDARRSYRADEEMRCAGKIGRRNGW